MATQHQRLGDPEITISLPSGGETLGLQFSVFGTCTAIAPGADTTLTVTVKDGANDVATASDVRYNLRNHTFEAFFNLSGDTNIVGTGSVVAALNGTNFSATNTQLTIRGQSALTIGTPTPGADFASWAAGVVAGGQVTGDAGKTMWLRLTDAGFDIIPHQSWVIGDDAQWQLDLGALVTALQNKVGSSNFSINVSVWVGGQQLVRVSSGFFSVQG